VSQAALLQHRHRYQLIPQRQLVWTVEKLHPCASDAVVVERRRGGERESERAAGCGAEQPHMAASRLRYCWGAHSSWLAVQLAGAAVHVHVR